MCGFVGFSNFNKDLSSYENLETLKILTKTLTHRGPNEEGFYTSRHTNLGHKRLIVIDPKKRKTTYEL